MALKSNICTPFPFLEQFFELHLSLSYFDTSTGNKVHITVAATQKEARSDKLDGYQHQDISELARASDNSDVPWFQSLKLTTISRLVRSYVLRIKHWHVPHSKIFIASFSAIATKTTNIVSPRHYSHLLLLFSCDQILFVNTSTSRIFPSKVLVSMFNAGIVINLTLLLGGSSFSSSDSLSATSVSRAAGAASAVAICDAVHGTHNKSSKILHAHQRSYLCISTEWSTGTRESVLLSTSLIIRRQTRICIR